MAQVSIEYKLKNLNVDGDALMQTSGGALFIKDIILAINKKGSVSENNLEHGDLGLNSPSQSNIILDVNFKLPIGNNRSIGSYECKELSEVYWFNYNDLSNHNINYFDKESNKAHRVYEGKCLNFSEQLEFSIPNYDVILKVIYDVSECGTQKTIREKLLIFTDGLGDVRQVNVLASIGSNSFTTKYFDWYKDDCCSYITLAPIAPMDCPIWKAQAASDVKSKDSELAEQSLQVAYQYVYVDGRQSSISPYSEVIQMGFANCSSGGQLISKCVDVQINIGNPFVEKIIIYKRSCGGDWVLYDIIYKHKIKVNEKLDWWNRTDAWSTSKFSKPNFISYSFCNNKKCSIIDQTLFNNLQNDIPFASKGLTIAGDRLLLANNLRGSDNLTIEQKESFDIIVNEKEVVDNACKDEVREIIVWMKIEGRRVWNNQPDTWNSFLYGDSDNKAIDGKFLFGGLCHSTSAGDDEQFDEDIKSYQQYVPEKVGGFVATLNGIYTAVSEQWRVYNCGKQEKIGIIHYPFNVIDENNETWDVIVNDMYENRYSIYQKFTFKVPKGIYRFRVHGHRQGLDAGYQNTSTYIYDWLYSDKGCNLYTNKIKKNRYEGIINVCEKDFDSLRDDNSVIRLFEFSNPDANQVLSVNNIYTQIYENYIYEDTANTIPIEGAKLQDSITDHNGFSFVIALESKGTGLPTWLYFVTGFQLFLLADLTNPLSGQAELGLSYQKGCSIDNIKIGISPSQKVGLCWTHKESVNTASIDKTKDIPCSRYYVKGKIQDSTGNPIVGAYVFTDLGGQAYTDSNGEYSVINHKSPTDLSYSNRSIYYALSSGGNCILKEVDCKCVEPVPYILGTCCIDINMPLKILNYSNTYRSRLFGRYIFGVSGYDCYGRIVIGGINKIKQIDTKNIKGDTEISWNHNPLVKLPSCVKYIKFSRTRNLDGEFIEWIADNIDYLNVKGEVVTNSSQASYVRVDINSLIKYNVNNNFNTNTIYQFVEGDYITFIEDNGVELDIPPIKITGTRIDTQDTTVVTVATQESGNKLIIPTSNNINPLVGKKGIKFRINRKYKCEDLLNGYFELCETVRVNNGVLEKHSGILNTVDTYSVFRNIKSDDNGVNFIVDTFNSNYISDFVNKSCTMYGRIGIENEFAEKKWERHEIAESNSWVNNGVINGLTTFLPINVANTKSQEFGGIVALHSERNILIAITENDYLTMDYNINYVRISESGALQVPAENRISEPHQKIGNKKGCKLEHKSTIVFNDDYVTYFNIKDKEFVFCPYNKTSDLSMAGVKSYFIDKINHINQLNYKREYSEKWEIISGIDPMNEHILITFREKGTNVFTNNNKMPFVKDGETIVYDIKYKMWSRFTGFVPEYYGQLRDSNKGNIYIAFKNGLPYIHNSKDVNTYCNFFGEQVQPVATIPVSVMENNVKNFIGITQNIQGQNLILDMIHTEEKNSFSYIPNAHWRKKENVYYAPILRDMSSFYDPNKPNKKSMLMDGKRMFGEFAIMRFTMPMDKANKYWQLNNFLILVNKSELSGKNQTQNSQVNQ